MASERFTPQLHGYWLDGRELQTWLESPEDFRVFYL